MISCGRKAFLRVLHDPASLADLPALNGMGIMSGTSILPTMRM